MAELDLDRGPGRRGVRGARGPRRGRGGLHWRLGSAKSKRRNEAKAQRSRLGVVWGEGVLGGGFFSSTRKSIQTGTRKRGVSTKNVVFSFFCVFF